MTSDIFILVFPICICLFYFLINKFLKKKLRLDLLLTSLVIVIGWYICNRLETSRDLENKRREQRVEMLVKAFQGLTKAYDHDPWYVKEDIQSALIEIQLLGTPVQAKRIELLVKDMIKEHKLNWGDYDNIVEDLRSDLRKELKLPKIEGKVWWIKISGPLEALIAEMKQKLADPNVSEAEKIKLKKGIRSLQG